MKVIVIWFINVINIFTNVVQYLPDVTTIIKISIFDIFSTSFSKCTFFCAVCMLGIGDNIVIYFSRPSSLLIGSPALIVWAILCRHSPSYLAGPFVCFLYAHCGTKCVYMPVEYIYQNFWRRHWRRLIELQQIVKCLFVWVGNSLIYSNSKFT